jgi:hypothetical protein
MKVTFTCERCGHEFCSHLLNTDKQVETVRAHLLSPPACPSCAKLTYGPLTEEMVAEALRRAAFGEPSEKWPETHLHEEFTRQARFVLRLLKDHNEGTASWHYGLSREPARRRLLALAREL